MKYVKSTLAIYKRDNSFWSSRYSSNAKIVYFEKINQCHILTEERR